MKYDDMNRDQLITELLAYRQKLADTRNALKQNTDYQQKYVELIQESLDGFAMLDRHGCFTFCNPVYCDITGYTSEDLKSKNYKELTPVEYHQLDQKQFDEMRASGFSDLYEKEYIRSDGKRVPIEIRSYLIRDKKERFTGTWSYVRDISERKKSEIALRKSEEKYRNLYETMTQGVVHQDAEGRIISANPAAETLLGLSLDQMQGKTSIDPSWKSIHEDGSDYPGETHPAMIALQTGKPVKDRVMGVFNPTTGNHRWLNINAIPKFRENEDRPYQVFTVFDDITERKTGEQHIEHLNRVLRSIRDINQLIVREHKIENLIQEACRLLVENSGYSSALIVLTDDNDHPLSWAESGITSASTSLNAMLEHHQLPPCCESARSARGAKWIEARTGDCENCPIAGGCQESPSLCVQLIHEESSFGYVAATMEYNLSVDDEELSLFTEMAGDLAYALNFLRLEKAHELSKRRRKILEDQLIQAQKMESVGRLAGGVAHDYNNISSIIIGYSELALEKVESSDSLHDDLMEILTAARRSTDITRQLLAFARQQTVAPKVIDLDDTIESMLKMLRRLIGEDIDLTWLPGAKKWRIKVDPSQIDQILANLCVNARDAIMDVGKVSIETKHISFDKDYCAEHAGVVPGDFLMLAVSDNGCGIPAETRDKIFEPFFTTKSIGKGTGLGLATVYGIIKQNNGFINVYSEPDMGTSIKIYLPRYTGPTVASFLENTQEIPMSRGSEVVLLVEDDPSILKLGERILENLAYTVLCAQGPQDAIRLAEEHAGKIKLLITDVVMPEMNGRELSEKLQGLCINLKILFMSGYTANVIAHRGVIEDGVSFISKPFSKRDLAIKVRKILDEARH